jgi:hypothetical protein
MIVPAALSVTGFLVTSTNCGNTPDVPNAGASGSSASGSSQAESGSRSSGSAGASAGETTSGANSGRVASSGSTSGQSGSIAASGTIAGSGKTAGGDATAASGESVDAGTDAGGLDTSASVLERNKHPSRDGNFLQPMLTRSKVATMALDTTFAAKFNGAMWASPLYLEQGPGGKGIFIAVTTGNDVYALDETTGAVVWHVNVGSSPTATGVPCGNISPLGILSTPVIDPTPGPDGYGTLYVAGAIGTTSIDHHAAFALSVKDGSPRAGWPVNVSALQSAAATAAGVTNFHAAASNQRSALSLVGGTLYIAYGGHVGDCDTYHGWVVAISTADPTKTGAWMTGGQGEAIWAAGGMASDGNGVIAVTGNRNGGGGPHQDSEEVVRVTGLATLTRSNANTFYPTGNPNQPLWSTLDQGDLDFGSNSPVALSVGSTGYVAAVTKNGDFFLLNGTNFGGTDTGNLVPPGGAYLKVAANGMSVRSALAAYTSSTMGSMGVHVTFTAAAPQNCPGGRMGNAVMSVLLSPATPPVPTVAWCAPMGSQTSPIATTIDGTSDSIVWFVDNGTLNAVDGDKGMTLVKPTGRCNNVRQWTSPIAVKGRIIAGGDGNLCSWSIH